MGRRMKIGAEFSFDSAHYLPEYRGACEAMHGHTYRLRVTIEGEAGSDGMVLDFREIKRIVKEHALGALDHRLLNDLLAQPTAENIAVWIWERLSPHLPLAEIQLWENPTTFVVYCGGRDHGE